MGNLAVDRWKQLSALYEQAVDLPPTSLRVWLDELRAQGHPLADELAKMLAARDRAAEDAFMATLPPLAPVLPAAPETATGDRIGPWRLVQPIGRGGMAEVWLAQRDDGSYFRRVALKLLLRHVAAGHRETFLARFGRERDILSTLNHPNIAAMFDAGVTDTGQPWLALEYVEGEPLIAACDRQAAPLRRRIELFLQVLQAVQHAHANLVVHRDLKPANILLTREGSVKLLDFGIAKLAESEGEALAETELTRLDGRPLTLAYAAPEQLQGLPLTTACDVYSLGVVLYELLTGLRPYELKAETPAQIELAILESEPRSPSRRELSTEAAGARGSTPESLRRQIAPDLDAIVLRTLAKEPSQRYGSVESLRADLQRWLDGVPVSARVPSAWYRTRKFAARHRVGVALGALSLAGLTGLAVTATLFALQAREESARAVAARDFMIDIFRNADPEKARGASITAGEMLDAGRKRISEQWRGQPGLQLEMLNSIAGILSEMGDYERSEPTRGEVTRLAERLGRTELAVRSELRRAVDLVSAGQSSRAEQALAGATRLAARAPRTDSLRFEQRWTEAVVDNVLGRYDAASKGYEEALVLATASYGPHSRQVLNVLRGQAVVAWHRGNHATALAIHQRISDELPSMNFLSAREVVELAYDRVTAIYSAGHFAAAWAQSSEALVTAVGEVGRWDPNCRLLRRMRAMAALRLGQTGWLTDGDLQELRADATEVADPVEGLLALMTLLRVKAARGDVADIAPLRDELTQRQELLQRKSAIEAGDLHAANLAVYESLLRQGQPATVLDETARLLQSADLPTLWRARFGVMHGVSLLQSGRPAEAVDALGRAVGGFAEVHGADHALTHIAALNLALALAADRQRGAAVRQLDASLVRLRQDLGDTSPTVVSAMGLRDALRSTSMGSGTRDPRLFFN